MQFDPFASADLDLIRDLQPEGWGDITNDFRSYTSHEFCYPLKVTLANKLVGVGNAIVFNRTAWLSHIIVQKEHRNGGIGFEIVKKLLEDVKNKSANSVSLIATNLGEPVYLKAGFRIVSEYLSFKRDKPWIDSGISEHIKGFEDKFYVDIMRLDKQISGEAREPLLQEYLAGSYVYLNHNAVTGFYLPGLGEGPVLASGPDAGVELMRIKYPKADKAIIPAENKTAIKFLQENGFISTGIKGRRMVYGKDIRWQPEKYFSRIGGNYG
jgi:hypothetical protein